MKRIVAIILSSILLLSSVSCTLQNDAQQTVFALPEYNGEQATAIEAAWGLPESDMKRYYAVKEYAEKVILEGRDPYEKEDIGKTPLFADGVDVESGEPFMWADWDGYENAISNMASHLNLFRIFDGLSNLTKNEYYRQNAYQEIDYMTTNMVGASGLLYWGGHTSIDLKTMKPFAGPGEDVVHELKFHLPDYDFLFNRNPEFFKSATENHWRVHIKNWDRLEMNRHGPYYKSKYEGTVWSEDPPIESDSIYDYKTRSLTFICSGTELIMSAIENYLHTGNERALLWGMTLQRKYENASNPKTGLLPHMYLLYSDNSLETTPLQSDRFYRQAGADLGDAAIEPWLLSGWENGVINGITASGRLYMAEKLGLDTPEGKEFLDITVQSLKSNYKYALDKEKNQFKTILGDGTDITGYEMPAATLEVHQGNEYFRIGTKHGNYTDIDMGGLGCDGLLLSSYAKAYLLSKDTEIAEMLGYLSRQNGIGDFSDINNPNIDIETKSQSPRAIFATLDLYEATGNEKYLDLARKIGDNIVDNQFIDGYFVKGSDAKYAWFGALEPHALLKLHSVLIDQSDGVPDFTGGNIYNRGGILLNGEKRDSFQEVEMAEIKK